VPAKLLTGAPVAENIKSDVRREIARLAPLGIRPGLAAVLVGNDPASHVYVNSKVRACEELGLYSEKHELPETETTEQLLDLISSLNANEFIDGILVQLPLPSQVQTRTIIEAVDPDKDVDGFSPVNVGRLVAGQEALVSCTPVGILQLLDFYSIPIGGAHAVVIGRSDIVGKPMSLLLLHRNATITICHSKTRDLGSITREADILVAAIGKPGLITREMIRPGGVIIDVGVNRVSDQNDIERLFEGEERKRRLDVISRRGFTLVGDVEVSGALERASAYTPVPGGVGPLTIATLMKNTVRAAQMRRQMRPKM
jgi:methylenetetrahydrofolate dehydrogenase (NADP+) / methenyltetrahydrofolate cyclohydrolase